MARARGADGAFGSSPSRSSTAIACTRWPIPSAALISPGAPPVEMSGRSLPPRCWIRTPSIRDSSGIAQFRAMAEPSQVGAKAPQSLKKDPENGDLRRQSLPIRPDCWIGPPESLKDALHHCFGRRQAAMFRPPRWPVGASRLHIRKGRRSYASSRLLCGGSVRGRVSRRERQRRTEFDRRRREGHDGRDDARGDRRGVEPRADRENTSRGQRWHRPVPDRRPAAWHVFGDIHVDRVPNRRSPGHPTARQLHGPGQRRPADRCARRNADGHWRVAHRRRHQQPVVGGARPRCARRDSDDGAQPADARGADPGIGGHVRDAGSVRR